MRRFTNPLLFGLLFRLLLVGAVAVSAQQLGALPLLARTGAAAAQSARQSANPNLDEWQADLKRRHDELIRSNGPGTNPAVRDQLLAMLAQDQQARGLAGAATSSTTNSKEGKKLQVAGNLNEIDAALSDQLKALIATHGWPTIALVGIDASNAAMLILTHSRDHVWQRSLLPQLEQLANHGAIDGSSLALVVDKELISEGKPQRYGSQFKLVDGKMAMYAVEDPGGLDGIRARVFLPPMDVYKKQLSDMYHFQVSTQIVQPMPPRPADSQ